MKTKNVTVKLSVNGAAFLGRLAQGKSTTPKILGGALLEAQLLEWANHLKREAEDAKSGDTGDSE